MTDISADPGQAPAAEAPGDGTPPGLGLAAPEGIDGALLGAYEQQAMAAGLGREQAESLMQWWVGQDQARQQQAQQHQADAIAALQRDWGSQYKQRLTEARHAVRQFGGDELASFLEQSGLGDHPALIRAFAEAAKRSGEDRMAGRSQNAGFALSPAQAKGEVNRLFSDAAFLAAYTDPRHVGHDDAVAKMVRLNQLAGA